MPDVASVPDQLKATGLVYQPSWSAARAGTTAERTGGVWSMRMTEGVVDEAVLPSVPVAEHVRVVPVVSSGMSTAAPQPLESVESALTDQCTVTGPTYQPLLPTAPERVYEIEGAVARATAGPSARASAMATVMIQRARVIRLRGVPSATDL
jgi:hypothetical protein